MEIFKKKLKPLNQIMNEFNGKRKNDGDIYFNYIEHPNMHWTVIPDMHEYFGTVVNVVKSGTIYECETYKLSSQLHDELLSYLGWDARWFELDPFFDEDDFKI